MRRSFSINDIQRWTLIDLNPWEESLVRQQLRGLETNQRNAYRDVLPGDVLFGEELLGSGAETVGPTNKLSVATRRERNSSDPGGGMTSVASFQSNAVAEAEDFSGSMSTHTIEQSHVILIKLNRQSQLHESWREIGCIRLLWDWGLSSVYAQQNAYSAGLDGVVRGPASLRSWIRVCRNYGPRALTETHPILSKISIPSLVRRDRNLFPSSSTNSTDRNAI